MDAEFSSEWATIVDDLNEAGSQGDERRVETKGSVILRDGTVVEDRAVDAAVTTAFDGLVRDMPLGAADNAIVGTSTSTSEILKLLGWPPVTTGTLDELFHDDDARQYERAQQTYENVRKTIACTLNAFIDLDIGHLNFGIDVDALERARDEARAALGLLNAQTAPSRVCYDFPGGVTVTVAFAFAEFRAAEVIKISAADSTGLYRSEDTAGDADRAALVDIASTDMTGATITIPADTYHSTLRVMDFTTATRIDIEEVLAS